MARFAPSRREGGVIESLTGFDVRRIGGHMSRQRYQRGTLKSFVPAAKGKPKRQLPRGSYWARWYRYIKQADGQEKRSPREKIITRDLARSFRIGTEYEGPFEELPPRPFWFRSLRGGFFFNRHEFIAELLSLAFQFRFESFLPLGVALCP